MSKKENSKKLWSAFGQVDEKYIDECLSVKKMEKGRSIYFKAACAAAVVLVAVSAAAAAVSLLPSFSKPSEAVEQSKEEIMPTSEKYESLEELLQSVRYNDAHNEDQMTSNRVTYKGNKTVDGFNAASSVVMYKEYAYNISEGGVSITRLSEKETLYIGIIDARAEKLLLCGDKLILFRTDYDDPLGGKPTVTVEVYELSAPEKPQLSDVLTQSGSYVESCVQNGRVYLTTSDGVCACGYSRSDDIEEYLPEIMLNSEKQAIDKDEIFILGEPTAVRFTTLTAYDPSSAEIISTNVFYGDADKCFSSENRIAFCVESRGELYASAPVLYVFDIINGADFMGKINLSAALNVPAVWFTGSSEKRAEVIYAEINDNVCRVIGTVYSSDNNNNKSEIYALLADISSGKYQTAFSQSKTALAAIDEIVDMGDKKLIISSSFDINTMESHARLACADFSGESPVITESSFEVDAVSGVDMLFSYGRPYGYLFPTMLLDGGIAVRYNGIPNGMDIFDISNPSDIKLLHSSGNLFGNDKDRFLIQGSALSGKYIAVLKASPREDYRLLDICLCVYEILPHEAQPIRLVCEYEIDKCDSIGLVEHNGSWYCINTGFSAPDGAIINIEIP